MISIARAFQDQERDLGVRLAIVPIAAETAAALPALSAAERSFLSRLRFAKRRREWLAGRLAAKAAVLRLLGGTLRPHQVEVLPAPDRKPCVLLRESACRTNVAVTITHSSDWAAAVAFDPDFAGPIGLDLERLQPVDPALYPVAFTAEEIAWIEHRADAQDRLRLVLRLWTAKEAVLKAAGIGLQACLQSLYCSAGGSDSSWSVRLALPGHAERWFQVHSAAADGYVLSLASPQGGWA